MRYILASIAGCSMLVMQAQVDPLDHTFGDNGVSQLSCGTNVYREPWAACPWTEGRILLAGSLATSSSSMRLMVISLLPDGSLDPSFGVGGEVEISVDSSYQRFLEIKVQPNGRILAAANVYGHIALVGFLADGSLDASFGTNGIQEVALSTQSLLQELELEILEDGRFLLGTRYGNNMAVMKFLEDGSMDNTFGNSGIALAPVPGTYPDVRAMEVLQNGRILIGGQYLAIDHQVWSLAEFLPNGDLAQDFGTNGVVLTDVNPTGNSIQHVSEFAIRPDGKIWACGESILDRGRMTLARYLANGALDPEFNNAVPLIIPSPEPHSSAQIEGMALLEDGDVLLGGNRFFWSMDTTEYHYGFTFYRVGETGQVDEEFGQDGMLFIQGGGNSKELVRDASGRFFLVGWGMDFCPYVACIDLHQGGIVNAIEEVPTSAGMIWPNPCTKEIDVAVPGFDMMSAAIRILDVQGRPCVQDVLISRTASERSIHLSLPETLSPGYYHVEVREGSKQQICPLIVQSH